MFPGVASSTVITSGDSLFLTSITITENVCTLATALLVVSRSTLGIWPENFFRFYLRQTVQTSNISTHITHGPTPFFRAHVCHSASVCDLPICPLIVPAAYRYTLSKKNTCLVIDRAHTCMQRCKCFPAVALHNEIRTHGVLQNSAGHDPKGSCFAFRAKASRFSTHI